MGAVTLSAAENLEKLLNETQHAPHSHTDARSWFKRVNLDVASRDLRLDAIGKERGERNEPPSDTIDFDEIEEAILDFVRDKRSEADQEFRTQRDDYLQRLTRNSLLNLVSEIDEAAKLAAAEIDTACAAAQGTLPPLAKAAKDRRADYDQFRTIEGIQRQASYPETTGAVLRWVLVIGLMLTEATANGFFFARGNAMGLVGGWSEAIIFAAANIVFALVVGIRVAGHVHHRSRTRKVLGWCGLGVWAIVTGALAMFVGHYRDALEAGQPDTYRAALMSMHIGLFNFHSLHSWVLFGAGLLFAVIAMLDAATMDDLYPGYGPVDRRLKEAELEYKDQREVVLERIQDAYSKAVETMNGKARTAMKRMADCERILVDIRTLEGSYKQHLTYLETVGNNLIRIYRDSNARARSTPKPQSFRKKWKEMEARLTDFIPPEFSKANLEKLLKDAEKRRGSASTRLEKKRTEATSSFKTLDEA